MPKWLLEIKDFLNIDNRRAFILAIVGWVLYFLPQNVWVTVGLSVFWEKYRPWSFVFGTIFTIWLISNNLFDIIKNSYNKFSSYYNLTINKKKRKEALLSLSRVEKEILAMYLGWDTTTIAFDLRDGIVNGLIGKKILYRSSNATNPMTYKIDTNIYPWAWDFLQKNPNFLEGITAPENKRHSLPF